MNQRTQLRVDLTETSLPEALFEVHRLAAAGVLEARRERSAVRLLIREGCVIHAASTDRRDWLASYLWRKGRLSDEELAGIGERHRFSKRVGALLVERGILSPAGVYRAIQEQHEAIVEGLLGWQEGVVTFRIDPLEGVGGKIQIRLPVPRLVLAGARRGPNARRLVERLGSRESVLQPHFRIEELIEVGLEEDELELLRMVDGRRTVYELCSAGPFAAVENAKLLFGFVILDLVRAAGAAGRRDGPIRIRFKRGADRN